MSAPPVSQATELASRIYIELTTRVTLAPAQADKPKPSPEAMAKMSFRLADVFLHVLEERTAAPVETKYEVKLSDVGGN
jgi:hypothetical protein